MVIPVSQVLYDVKIISTLALQPYNIIADT